MPARVEDAGPANPKTTWNAVTPAAAITSNAAAHNPGSGPAECPLQSPMSQVDSDRNRDADHLQHQQYPVGKRTRIDQNAQWK